MTYPKPNQHGVYGPEVCEVIALPASVAADLAHRSHQGASAEIMLVQVGPRRWYATASYFMHSGDVRSSGAYPAAKWHDAYPERDCALSAMCDHLVEQMDRVLVDRADGEKREAAFRKKGFGPVDISVSLTEVAEAKRVALWAHGLSHQLAYPSQLEMAFA